MQRCTLPAGCPAAAGGAVPEGGGPLQEAAGVPGSMEAARTGAHCSTVLPPAGARALCLLDFSLCQVLCWVHVPACMVTSSCAVQSRLWQGWQFLELGMCIDCVCCRALQSSEAPEVRCLRRILLAWQEHAAGSRAAAWQQQQAAARLLRSCFAAWRQQAAARSLEAAGAHRWCNHRLLRKAMHCWARQYMACQRAHAMLAEAHEEMVGEAVARRSYRLGAAAVGGWRQQAWQGAQRRLAGAQWLLRAHARGMLVGWHRAAALDR